MMASRSAHPRRAKPTQLGAHPAPPSTQEQPSPPVTHAGGSCPHPARGVLFAGFIIGKGGRNIDQIEKASGAKLSVSDRNGPESFGKEWVYVQVSGTGGNVDRAKKLLVLNMIEATSRKFTSNQCLPYIHHSSGA